MVLEDFLGVNAAGVYGWQPYHLPVPLSWNLGTLTSWNPLGQSKPVTGLIYLYIVMKQQQLLIFVRNISPPVQEMTIQHKQVSFKPVMFTTMACCDTRKALEWGIAPWNWPHPPQISSIYNKLSVCITTELLSHYRGKYTVAGTIKTSSFVLLSLYIPLWCCAMFCSWNWNKGFQRIIRIYFWNFWNIYLIWGKKC